jgi:hypothetical protein
MKEVYPESDLTKGLESYSPDSSTPNPNNFLVFEGEEFGQTMLQLIEVKDGQKGES